VLHDKLTTTTTTIIILLIIIINTTNVELEMYDYTSYNWSHWDSSEKLQENLEAIPGKIR
jgi:hypothetical protein